jgi:hypothetical protein
MIIEGKTMKQSLWLVGIWAASIAALSVFTLLFKLLMRWAGLS